MNVFLAKYTGSGCFVRLSSNKVVFVNKANRQLYGGELIEGRIYKLFPVDKLYQIYEIVKELGE